MYTWVEQAASFLHVFQPTPSLHSAIHSIYIPPLILFFLIADDCNSWLSLPYCLPGFFYFFTTPPSLLHPPWSQDVSSSSLLSHNPQLIFSPYVPTHQSLSCCMTCPTIATRYGRLPHVALYLQTSHCLPSISINYCNSDLITKDAPYLCCR